MKARNAPIDEKWLDRPPAKRSSDGPSIGNSKRPRNYQANDASLRKSENSGRVANSTEAAVKLSKNVKDSQQTNLFSFFSASSAASKSEISHRQQKETKIAADKSNSKTGSISRQEGENQSKASSGTISEPMIPSTVPQARNVMWRSPNENIIIRKVQGEEPRSKVAAFDLDGTLMVWRTGGNATKWPSKLEHYELWSSSVPAHLRALHDDGYKLVLISNQGAVRKAHDGKKATLVKNVINWIAKLVDRPIHAVMSTKSPKNDPKNSHHKPTEKMWGVAIQYLNNREPFEVSQSFFVGDSADLNDEQGGVDFRFSQSVGKVYGEGSQLQFYEPSQRFGPSDASRRAALRSKC